MKCSKCQLEKPSDQFYKNRGACKACRNAYRKEYRRSINRDRCRQLDSEYKKRNRKKIRAGEYGLTVQDLDAILDHQKNTCPGLCGRNPSDIDHDHKTNKVRGVLCRSCNLVLGHVRDNPLVLEALAIYLRSQES